MKQNKLKILILQGPPASGKSFFVNKFLNEDINRAKKWVAVSRDSIRESTGTY